MAVRFQQQQQEQQQDPGDAAPAPEAIPAAAATPEATPAGKIAGGAKGKVGNRAAKPTKTLEQRSALADRALARITTGEEPEAKPAPAKAEEKPAAADGKKPEAKPAEPAVELSDVAKAAIATLLKAGKLHDLAALAGMDAKAVDASNAKLRLVRERDELATVKETKATNLVAEAKSIREDCKKEFGDPHRARKAVDKGEWVEAVQYLEKILQVDFGTLTRNVASATKGMDPKALESWKKERELKAREEALTAKETKTATEKTEQERTAKATKTIRVKVDGHPALKLEGGDRQILKLLEDNFDEKTGTLGLGYKQAADKVLEAFDVQAKALGYTKAGEAKPEVKPAEKKPEAPAGKKPFEAPPGTPVTADGKRRGSTFEERSARADRQFGRSKVL